MQAPRHSVRMRVGRCMQRKSWGGEVERTGMVQCRGTGRWGTVVGVCLVPEGGVRSR